MCRQLQCTLSNSLVAVLLVSAVTSTSYSQSDLPERSPIRIDNMLVRNGLRHGTFGPTGERLFAERLDDQLGLAGQFCYIHHANIQDPARVEIHVAGQQVTPVRRQAHWYPSRSEILYQAGDLTISECKFITDNDLLVTLIELKNASDKRIEADIHITSAFAQDQLDGADRLVGQDDFYGIQAYGILAAGGFSCKQDKPALRRTVTVAPKGGAVELAIVFAMHPDKQQAIERINKAIEKPGPLKQAHIQQYNAWFDNCPVFQCDDAYLEKLYWYRWFVARHCLSRAEVGRLPEPYFFEGTHQPHFPRLIAFSSPHIITETRWLRDPQFAFGQVRNHCQNPDDEHGFFISSRINEKGGDYNNWIVDAAWGAFLVHPDRTWLADVVDAWIRDVEGTLARFDRDGDRLPTPVNHWTTGMEFQPAFFYFNDYDDTKPEAPLERGDFVAYLYDNCRSLAAAMTLLDRQEEASRFNALADEIRSNCLAKMWDAEDSFFYAIREHDDAVARCREIVGFYPFQARLVPDEPAYMKALDYLVDPEEFWVPFPPATVTKQCPAFTHKIATWPAAGGRTHGCMWNGQQWPHATSYILDVIAAVLRDYDQKAVTPKHFWNMLDRYTHLQFEADALDRPYVTEYYNSATGAPDPHGCADYFHSTYCDLIIRHVVGLLPSQGSELTIDPIPGSLKRFSLRSVHYRNHELDIVYNATGDPANGPDGLTVWVDGRRAGHRKDLGRLTITLGHEGRDR